MLNYRVMAEAMLAPVGIAIDGDNPWDMKVRDERLFPRIFRERNLGLGEAYMDGW
jgi:cyclopropane-fatty-acyl-phospholipid synthase